VRRESVTTTDARRRGAERDINDAKREKKWGREIPRDDEGRNEFIGGRNESDEMRYPLLVQPRGDERHGR
jgi:hypothetical protein